MTVYSFRVGPYARDIYLYGGNTLTNIPAEYYTPVEKYAADNFTRDMIENAYTRNWITEQQYLETLALITKEVILPTSLKQTTPTN